MLEAFARALFDARRYGEAADRFTELVETSPDNDYARFGLGLSRMRLGDLTAAVEQLALATAMRPERAEYQQALREARATVRAREDARPDRSTRPAQRPARREPVLVTEPLVAGCDSPLATRHDVALLDLDGVLYVGPDAVPGAPEAVRAAAAAGMRPAYVTNNASRTPEAVAAHLRELGLPADDRRRGDLRPGRRHAGRRPGARPAPRCWSSAARDWWPRLRERGLAPVPAPAGGRRPWCRVSRRTSAGVGWPRRVRRRDRRAVGREQLDATIPTPRGTAPGNGTLVGVVARTVGRPPDAVAGKPETPLHQESVQRTGAEHPLVIGDRLDTDIEGAQPGRRAEPAGAHRVSRPVDLLRAGPAAAADLPGGRPGVRVDAAAPRSRGRRCRLGLRRLDRAGDRSRGDGDRRR